MMNRLRSDQAPLSTSMKDVEDAIRVSGMQRAVRRFRGWFIEYPDAEQQVEAPVTDIEVARAKHESDPEQAPANATEGEVVDLAQRRQRRDLAIARENIAAALEEQEQLAAEASDGPTTLS